MVITYIQISGKYDDDCLVCWGSGRFYLGDGAYTGCDCSVPVGPYFRCYGCKTCGDYVVDRSRKITSRRIRAHLRMKIMKKDTAIISRLESLFVDGMGWHNRGEWHIDHIKPIKSFLDDGVEDVSLINAPSNLQPLWAKDNLLKGSKW
jgi:hypothetical protein